MKPDLTITPEDMKGFLLRIILSLTTILCLIFAAIGCQTKNQSPLHKNRDAQSEESTAQALRPYIDAHNHLAGGRQGSGEYFAAASKALDAMERLGIEKMLIMPPPFSPELPRSFDMEDLLPVVRKFHGRVFVLGGGGSLNLMIHEAHKEGVVTPELKKRFEERALEILSKGAVGFGEFAVEHFSLGYDHPYESAPADHPLFLLLADIAARAGVPMDIHMEAVPKDMPLPDRDILKRSGRNPKTLRANIPAFERLLAHNGNAKIIWAHVGWCNTGYRTPGLCRDLLSRHPNLYMSFKLSPESVPEVRPISRDQRSIRPEWLQLLRDFPGRFVIGTDQFYVPPGSRQIGPQKTEATRLFMNLLPPDLAWKIGIENPSRLFNLQ
jgi:predicted TIM-barrel fold metal-dependent hydrolase